MEFFIYDPIPELKPYIKVISALSCITAEDACPFRVLPDGCTELFVNYSTVPLATVSGSEHKRSFVSARLSRFMDVRMSAGAACISVCFYPEAAGRFFPVPMHALVSSATELYALWARHAAEMEEKVVLAASNAQRVEIIQQYLLSALKQDYREDKTVSHCLWQISRLNGQQPVKALVKDIGLSQRQLNRRFHNQVGLSLKEFSRISRFIYALDNLKKDQQYDLTQVAYQSGYYDQAHFIHDFKDYAGITPKQLDSFGRIIF